MSIQEAIKKAIDNGFEFHSSVCLENDFQCFAINDWELFCIKPQFWQCLGKAMGWDEKSIFPLSSI